MKRYIIVLLAVLVAAVSSCKKAPSVVFESDTVTVSFEGGNLEIPMQTNYDWSVSSGASWISVVTKSGEAGDAVLRLKISTSKLPDDRTGEVSIACDNLVKTLTIVQTAKPQVVFDGESSIVLTAEKQTFRVSFSSNFDYDVSTDADWLRCVGTKAMVSGAVQLEADENVETIARTANLVFTDRNGGTTVKMEVSQSGRQQTFTLVHDLGEFKAPTVFGFGATILIDWGDGTLENYSSNLKHKYSKSGDHTVTVSATSASTVSVTDLVGVSLVDITEF